MWLNCCNTMEKKEEPFSFLQNVVQYHVDKERCLYFLVYNCIFMRRALRSRKGSEETTWAGFVTVKKK